MKAQNGELPPKQKLVYDAATNLVAQGKPVTSRTITEIVDPKAFDFSAAIARTKSTIDILRKKDMWNFPQLRTPSIKSESSVSTTPVETLCQYHETEENAVHDFGVKVLEAFTGLPRNAQVKLWDGVGGLLDKTMKKST